MPSSRDTQAIQTALEAWLTKQVGESVSLSDMRAPQGAGFSAETLLFDASWASEAGSFVLKMPPLASDLPVFETYDLGLQVNIVRIAAERSEMLVPNVRWYEQDSSVLGAEFYIMDQVDGRAAPDNPPYIFGSWVTEASVVERRHVQKTLATNLVALHNIEVDDEIEALLRQGDGSPIDQHLRAQREYYEWCRDDYEFPLLLEALDWLEANRPEEDPVAISWGDARIGNTLFDGVDAKACVDWEMATLAAPELDVAWSLVLHHFFLEVLRVMEMQNPLPDFFVADEWLSDYAEAGGPDLPNLEWWYMFGLVRYGILSTRVNRRRNLTENLPEPESSEGLILNAELIRATLAGNNPYM